MPLGRRGVCCPLVAAAAAATLVSWAPRDEKWHMWGMGSQATGSSVSSGSMSPCAHGGERHRRLDRGGRPSVQPGVRAGLPSGWGPLVFLTS